jgi:MoxR-like ATPase
MSGTNLPLPIAENIDQVRTSVARVIVGQTDLVDHILIAMLAGGHVLLEGVPGVAKTLAARLTARLLDCTFARIQFTPDLMPADILGTNVFDPRTTEFVFRKGPVFANIVLADEINRAPAKTQSALFEVMEEGQATIDGIAYPMPRPNMVIATQNPIEHEGTYRLPEAQLDRFLMKVIVGYPTLDEEIKILELHHHASGASLIDDVQPLLSAQALDTLRAAVRTITVETSIMSYIAQIVQRTRSMPLLDLGASPRGSLGLLSASKAAAAIDGRDFVIPDDVQRVAPAILRHRIRLIPEREMEGMQTDDVISEILHAIDIPR